MDAAKAPPPQSYNPRATPSGLWGFRGGNERQNLLSNINTLSTSLMDSAPQQLALLLVFKPPAKRGAESVPLSSQPQHRWSHAVGHFHVLHHMSSVLTLLNNVAFFGISHGKETHDAIKWRGGRPLAGTATITHPARSPTLVLIRRWSHDSSKYFPARLMITHTFILSTKTKHNLPPLMNFHLLFPGLRIGGHRWALPLSVHVEHCTVAKSTQQRGRGLTAMGRGGTPGDEGGRCHGYLLTLRAHWLAASPGGRGWGCARGMLVSLVVVLCFMTTSSVLNSGNDWWVHLTVSNSAIIISHQWKLWKRNIYLLWRTGITNSMPLTPCCWWERLWDIITTVFPLQHLAPTE